MNILIYFIYISISILLAYNFLTTVFFCFKKELLIHHKNIQAAQKLLLVAQLFALIMYLYKIENSSPEIFLACWIWGFLTSRLFLYRKRQMHELLGLGILLAITIVLFFKQEEIIHLVTQQELKAIKVEIAITYLLSGLFLGTLFWPKSKS